MNIQQFLFKLLVILTYILRVSLLVLPVALVIVISKEDGWKYGFTFIQNNIDVALFVSFAIGFLVSMYHAVSFELAGKAPNENYMKSKQKVFIKGDISLEDLGAKLQQNKRYKEIVVGSRSIGAKKLVHLMKPDDITISHDGDVYVVESQPFTTLWFIDFGRNFRTVTEIAKMIKQQ